MTLPDRIENCPIVEATLEIRFESNIYPSAVFGVIYNALKEKYPIVEKLPILQFPEELREKDSNLKFKPTYKAIGKDFTIQIGSSVFTVSSNLPYEGWSKFSIEIEDNLKRILELNVIKKVNRLGLRL